MRSATTPLPVPAGTTAPLIYATEGLRVIVMLLLLDFRLITNVLLNYGRICSFRTFSYWLGYINLKFFKRQIWPEVIDLISTHVCDVFLASA